MTRRWSTSHAAVAHTQTWTRFPPRPYDDVEIAIQRQEEAQQPVDGEAAQTAAHERAHLRLIDAEQFSGPSLCQLPRPNEG